MLEQMLEEYTRPCVPVEVKQTLREALEEAASCPLEMPPQAELVASRRQHHGRKRSVAAKLRSELREVFDAYMSFTGTSVMHATYKVMADAVKEASIDPDDRLVDPRDSSRGALLDVQKRQLSDFQRAATRGNPRPLEPVVGSLAGKELKYARFSLWSGDHGDLKGDGAGHFIPELYAYLANYSTFRKRSYELLLVLKGRALAWARERDIADSDILPALPVCVAFAMDLSEVENAAIQHLRSELGGVAISTTARLSGGSLHVKKPVVGLDQWKRNEATFLDVVRSKLPVWIGPRTVLPSA
jgi:hypothetical protein